MAIEYESNCRGCPDCIGCYEGSTESPYLVCDDCGERFEPDELYDVDGQDVCAECLANRFETVEKKYRKEGLFG